MRSNQADRIEDTVSVQKSVGLRTDANSERNSLSICFGLEYDSVPRVRIESTDMDLRKLLYHLRGHGQRKQQSKGK